MKNSICVNGMWFHIIWNGKKGKDQLGNIWLNPEAPEMEDKKVMDGVLDAMNDVHRKVAELNLPYDSHRTERDIKNKNYEANR